MSHRAIRRPLLLLFASLALASAAIACGGAHHPRPVGPPPEYEEPTTATPSSTSEATPGAASDAGARD
jgi:hypothetical protein